MKKEIIYSTTLLLLSLILWKFNLMINEEAKHTYMHFLEGEPLPDFTEFSFKYPNIFLVYSAISLGLIVLAIKKFKYTTELIMATALTKILFVAIIAYSYSLPLISGMEKIGHG